MDWRERLLAYLRRRLPAADDVTIARLSGMPAGASNETVGVDLRLSCDGHEFELPLVLRPQRHHGILAPYDIGRQFAVMRALAATDVPVPPVLWYERDPAVLGVPFFFMGRVHGETLPLFWYGGSHARLAAAAETLARIHAVDWRAAGLGFLLPDPAVSPLPSPLHTELAQWRGRAEHLRVAHSPLLIALGSYLAANEPADARHALLHGDPNPGNYLFRGDSVVAVLDWELAAIGDPRSDLGFYAALLTVFGGMPGDGGRSVLSEAYEGMTGTPQHNLAYYEALGLYRMAIVMSGWGGFGGFYGQDAIARRLSVLAGPRWAG
ncbi:MAG: phosphotransferase family protein [Chloroflexi bacterium]|nr:phosphotransferase family protein [Chloroflexota bacterium]